MPYHAARHDFRTVIFPITMRFFLFSAFRERSALFYLFVVSFLYLHTVSYPASAVYRIQPARTRFYEK